jgi:hypothetical protein
MALLSIQSASRRPEAPVKEEDAFDKILKGLQIAQGVFGIKANLDRANLVAQQTRTAGLQASALERQESGVLTPAETVKLGLTPSEKGREFQVTGPEGAVTTQRFKTPGDVRGEQFDITTQLARAKGSREAKKFAKEQELLVSKLANKDNEKTTKSETDLRREWSNSPVTKDSFKLTSAVAKVREAVEAGTPASDISLIFNYMKILDPGSVVREGEFATAQNAASVPDRVQNQYNRVLQGTRLSPRQRSDFLKSAESAFQGHLKTQKAIDNAFIRLATQRGANPSNVVIDFGQGSLGTKKETPQKLSGTGPLPSLFPEAKAGQSKSFNIDEFLSQP